MAEVGEGGVDDSGTTSPADSDFKTAERGEREDKRIEEEALARLLVCVGGKGGGETVGAGFEERVGWREESEGAWR